MEQRHEWVLDLGRISPAPAPREEGAGQEKKTPKKESRRSAAQVLAQLTFLRGLYPAQIQKILRLCTVGSYAAAQEVCAAEARSDEMYILISGELAVLARDGAQAATIRPVTTVGELGFISNCRRPVGLVATRESKVLRLSRAKFERLLKDDTDMLIKVQRNIIEILSGRLTRLRDLVEGALSRGS